MSESPQQESNSITLPVLPLRDIVVFPHMIVPLFVGRDKSVRALEEVMAKDKQILLVAQKEASEDDPSPADVFEVGTVASVPPHAFTTAGSLFVSHISKLDLHRRKQRDHG